MGHRRHRRRRHARLDDGREPRGRRTCRVARDARVRRLLRRPGANHFLLRRAGGALQVAELAPEPEWTYKVTAEEATIEVVNGPVIEGMQTTEIKVGGSIPLESIVFANKMHVPITGVEGNDIFTVNNPNPAAGLKSLSLESAKEEGEHNVFDVQAAAVPLTVLGGGRNTVNLGMGNLQSITARVEVKDGNGLVALNVDDSADATGRTASIATDGTTDTISGLGPAEITAEVLP
jgi:hypothetical protein